MSTINPIATSGFAAASAYDLHRPSYPPEAVSSLLQHLNVDNALHARILDVGAGTGKFTELLAKREEEYEILAIEPHEGMRKELVRKGLKGVKVLGCGVEEMSGAEGVEEGWADAVVAAQSFHWFATEDALRQIHRVLAPGGIFGMIWNIEDYNARAAEKPTTVWESKIKEVMWAYDDGHPRYRHDKWREIFDGQLSSMPFTVLSADPIFSLPLGEDHAKWTVWLSRDAVWERFHTMSHISVLEGEELVDAKRKVYQAMDEEDVEENEKGEVALHGQTFSCWTAAIPGAPLKSGG